MSAAQPRFERVALIGIGLINGSLALNLRAAGLAKETAGWSTGCRSPIGCSVCCGCFPSLFVSFVSFAAASRRPGLAGKRKTQTNRLEPS